MIKHLATYFLSALVIRFSTARPESKSNALWVTDELLPYTYSGSDPVSAEYDEPQEWGWDENLITEPESYTEFLADADPGCSDDSEPPSKRRRGELCIPPTDVRPELPQAPFDTLGQSNRFGLDPIRIPIGPQIMQVDNIYCGNQQQIVVCDSAREQDKKPNGNGLYRLLNVRRGMIPFQSVKDYRLNHYLRAVFLSSLCISPHSIWCCGDYIPASVSFLPQEQIELVSQISKSRLGDGYLGVNGAEHGDELMDGNNLSAEFSDPLDLTVQPGDVADQCGYFVTLP